MSVPQVSAKVPFVDGSVDKGIRALAVDFVIVKFSFVPSTLGECQGTPPVPLVVFPFSSVDFASLLALTTGAESLPLVPFPLAFVFPSLFPLACALAVCSTFHKLTSVQTACCMILTGSLAVKLAVLHMSIVFDRLASMCRAFWMDMGELSPTSLYISRCIFPYKDQTICILDFLVLILIFVAFGVVAGCGLFPFCLLGQNVFDGMKAAIVDAFFFVGGDMEQFGPFATGRLVLLFLRPSSVSSSCYCNGFL
mmetsp:Transcript_6184/g.13903  ORF Transcript_6184/g.13903 Transcript_6184/m.13903 type:complete len:252 (+) Transcript_6184:1234-1989(+)